MTWKIYGGYLAALMALILIGIGSQWSLREELAQSARVVHEVRSELLSLRASLGSLTQGVADLTVLWGRSATQQSVNELNLRLEAVVFACDPSAPATYDLLRRLSAIEAQMEAPGDRGK